MVDFFLLSYPDFFRKISFGENKPLKKSLIKRLQKMLNFFN